MATLPTLPDWVDPAPLQGGGRNPASRVNDLASRVREQTINVSAQGQIVPLAYGLVRVTGSIYALAKDGTDLVLGVGWCLGEIDSIEAVYINDAAPDASVTMTHYMGTPTQGVDPTLSGLITAYNDSLVVDLPTGQAGIAHSVITIPEAAVDSGWPRIEAVINGRKILDPRDATISASDNPALIANDVITNGVFGGGMTVSGVADCADWCDSLIGGALKRCRAALLLEGTPLDDLLSLLSDYGEFFYSIDGAAVNMVPDEPVDTTSLPVYDDGSIVAGALSVTEASAQDTPTVCEVTITETTSGADPWGRTTVQQQRAGVATGDLARIPTSLQLPGVFRSEEAQVKAAARLAKLKHRRTIRFTTTDRGITAQRGDVVRVQSDAKLAGSSIDVRVTSVSQTEPGRWSVEAINYSDDHYPTTYSTTGGDVPVGLILPLAGSNPPPAGWDVFSDADGRYIRGAGGTYAPGDVGDATSATVSISGVTSTDGAHSGGSDWRIYGQRFGGSGSGRLDTIGGGHSHTFSATFTPYVHSVTLRLAIKSGSIAAGVQAEIYAFGLPDINSAELSRSLEYAGRIIGANSTFSVSEKSSFEKTFSLDNGDDTHEHDVVYSGVGPVYDGEPSPFPDAYTVSGSGGQHTHETTAVAEANPSRAMLAMFSASGTWTIQPGVIGMWSGSVASIPADWSLCDGTNGTPDLRDGFIEIAAEGNEGTTAGDNTVSSELVSMDEAGHSHTAVSYRPDQYPEESSGHSSIVYHSHSALEGTVSWTPAYYALAFIMYTPGA